MFVKFGEFILIYYKHPSKFGSVGIREKVPGTAKAVALILSMFPECQLIYKILVLSPYTQYTFKVLKGSFLLENEYIEETKDYKWDITHHVVPI